MTAATRVRVGTDVAHDISPRLLGSFVEHMGRAVYGGLHRLGATDGDPVGWREDVLALVRELRPRVVRYPGGNFVSGYRWEDGVGPHRPVRLDLAWRSLEPNLVGTNEFLAWCRLVGTEPMLAVNLGTRGTQEACDLLEYVNHPGGTLLSDLRRSHGVSEPHGVRLWCLGNEMDGPWQLGAKTATEYGRLAAETAKAMRLIDPSITLVACGSSGPQMPTFGAWEREVLSHCLPHVDYLSLHSYVDPTELDAVTLLASGDRMGPFIDQVTSIADEVAARQGSAKRIGLSFDEWNVWYLSDHQRRDPERTPWQFAPPVCEDTFTARDAVVVGDLLITLLNHSDRVHIGCLAQLVNVIAPIRTDAEHAWRQTTFYPFADVSAHLGDGLLAVEIEGRVHATGHGPAADVTAAASLDGATGGVALFLANRHPDLARDVTLLLDDPALRPVRAWLVHHDDPDAVNDAYSERVARTPMTLTGSSLSLPPCSWAVVLFEPG